MDVKSILDELARELNFKDASANCLPPGAYNSLSSSMLPNNDNVIIYCRVPKNALELEDVNVDLSMALKNKMWAIFSIDGTVITDLLTDTKIDLHDPDSIDELSKSFEGREWQGMDGLPTDKENWRKDLEIWQRISKQLNF